MSQKLKSLAQNLHMTIRKYKAINKVKSQMFFNAKIVTKQRNHGSSLNKHFAPVYNVNIVISSPNHWKIL